MNNIRSIHDAGHAIALIVLGFTDFTIDLDADETSTSFTMAATPPPCRSVVTRGVAIAAGAAAEVCRKRLLRSTRRRLDIDKKRGGLRADLSKLSDVALEVDVDDLHVVADGKLDHHFLLLTTVAVRLLQRRWADVVAVAAELRRRRRLTSEEIAAFLRQTRTERYHSSSAAA